MNPVHLNETQSWWPLTVSFYNCTKPRLQHISTLDCCLDTLGWPPLPFGLELLQRLELICTVYIPSSCTSMDTWSNIHYQYFFVAVSTCTAQRAPVLCEELLYCTKSSYTAWRASTLPEELLHIVPVPCSMHTVHLVDCLSAPHEFLAAGSRIHLVDDVCHTCSGLPTVTLLTGVSVSGASWQRHVSR